MGLADRQLNKAVYVVQGVGAAFAAIFLSVYLLGLKDVPKDVVYHSDPLVRTTLAVLGAVLIVAFIAAIAVAAFWKRRK